MILTNKTIEVIRMCLKTMSAVGNEKSKQDTKKALDEFDEYVCDIEDLYDNMPD